MNKGEGKIVIINQKILNIYINEKEEKIKKYFYDNGNYYIGQRKHGLNEGKGILYNENGKIIYDGYWVHDLKEGYWRYNYENGEYYKVIGKKI